MISEKFIGLFRRRNGAWTTGKWHIDKNLTDAEADASRVR